jgi:16S rRNA G966 N2-methylase RsmD
VRRDVFKFLVHGTDAPFHIIYIAPPQYQGLWADTLEALDGRGFLAKDGLVVAQIHPKEFEELKLQSLKLIDRRRYGTTELCFYAPVG